MEASSLLTSDFKRQTHGSLDEVLNL